MSIRVSCSAKCFTDMFGKRYVERRCELGFRGKPATSTIHWNDLSYPAHSDRATLSDRSMKAVALANIFLIYQWIYLKLSCVTLSSVSDSRWRREVPEDYHHPNRQYIHQATDAEQTQASSYIVRNSCGSQTFATEAPKPFLSWWMFGMLLGWEKQKKKRKKNLLKKDPVLTKMNDNMKWSGCLPRNTFTKVLSSSPSSVTKASTKRSKVAAFTKRTLTVSHSRCDISSSLSF